MTLRDAREHDDAPKSTFKESRSSEKYPYSRALWCSISSSKPSSFEGAAKQQVWRNAIMVDDMWDIVLS